MKKLFLLLALTAFIGANTITAASTKCIAKVECEKCGKKKCTKECKEEKKSEAKTCNHGAESNTAAAEAPKSCGMKKSCCKAKAKNASTETKTEEATPAEK